MIQFGLNNLWKLGQTFKISSSILLYYMCSVDSMSGSVSSSSYCDSLLLNKDMENTSFAGFNPHGFILYIRFGGVTFQLSASLVGQHSRACGYARMHIHNKDVTPICGKACGSR